MLHSSKTIVHFISHIILPHFNWTSVKIIAERNVIEAQVSIDVFIKIKLDFLGHVWNKIRVNVIC